MRGRQAGDARGRAGDQGVKQSKPAMEKRRRARINASLAELRSLIPHTPTRDNRKYTKLEKADILEMAVQYLRHLQEVNKDKSPAGGGTSYNLGYSECTQEVNQFLSSANPLAARIKGSLLDHLNGCAPHSTPDSPSSSPPPTETAQKSRPGSQFKASSIIARCLLSSTTLSGHLTTLKCSGTRATSPLTIVSSTSDDGAVGDARVSGHNRDPSHGFSCTEEANEGCSMSEETGGVTSDGSMTSGDDNAYTSGCLNTDVPSNDVATNTNPTEGVSASVTAGRNQGSAVLNISISNLSPQQVAQSERSDPNDEKNLEIWETLREKNYRNSIHETPVNNKTDQLSSSTSQFLVTDVRMRNESKKTTDTTQGGLENTFVRGEKGEQLNESLRSCDKISNFDSNGKTDIRSLTETVLNRASSPFTALLKSTAQHVDVLDKGKFPFPKLIADDPSKTCAAFSGNSISSCLVPIYVQTSFGEEEIQSFTQAFLLKSSAVCLPTQSIDKETNRQRDAAPLINIQVNSSARAPVLSARVDSASTSKVRREAELPGSAREDLAPNSSNKNINNVIGFGTVTDTVSRPASVGSRGTHSTRCDQVTSPVADEHYLNNLHVSKAGSPLRVLEPCRSHQEMQPTLSAPEMGQYKRKYPFLSIVTNDEILDTRESQGVDNFPQIASQLNRLPKPASKLKLPDPSDDLYERDKETQKTSQFGDLIRPRSYVHPSWPARDLSHHYPRTRQQGLTEQSAYFSGPDKRSKFDDRLWCDERSSDFETPRRNLCGDEIWKPAMRTPSCAGRDRINNTCGLRYKECAGVCRGKTTVFNCSACRDGESNVVGHVDCNAMSSVRCHGNLARGSRHVSRTVCTHGETAGNPPFTRSPQPLAEFSGTRVNYDHNANAVSLVRQNSLEPLNLTTGNKDSVHALPCQCTSSEDQTVRGSLALRSSNYSGNDNSCERSPVKTKADPHDVSLTQVEGPATASCDRTHRLPEMASRLSHGVRLIYGGRSASPRDQHLSGSAPTELPMNLCVTSPPKNLLNERGTRTGDEGRNTDNQRHPARTRFWASGPGVVSPHASVTTSVRVPESASLTPPSGASWSASGQMVHGQSEELDDDVWRPW